MSQHLLRCRCGTLRGELLRPRRTLHAVCYCRDCRAYAHALGDAARTLDADGGTDVVAARPRDVRIDAGRDALACLSLSERGLLRWYAGCCGTPLANTPRDPRVPYVGVVHSCLAASADALARAFGPVRMRVYTQHATRPLPKPGIGQSLALLRVAPGFVWDRLAGGWRSTPFFDAAASPVAEPRVLSADERRRAIEAG